MTRPIKLGIVSNEFFDLALGRMGGFGWAARQVARCFGDNSALGVEAVFISREHRGDSDLRSHNTRLIPIHSNLLKYAQKLRNERINMLLFINYQASYRPLFFILPWTPIVVWARDPRTSENTQSVRDIRIPGHKDVVPVGSGSTRSNFLLKYFAIASALIGRPMQFAYTSDFLKERIERAYMVPLSPENSLELPNIIDMDVPDVPRSSRPKFAFLGRLDPYKRPWLFAELAEHFPDADFVFMGQDHFPDRGWNPENVPNNVRFLGHVGEQEKARELASSWAVVNTAHHEGLPVSLQEACKCATPIVSSVDPEGIVSKFGLYVGDYPGSGRESIPQFVAAISRLMEDEELRMKLGQSGQKWVESTHNLERFLAAFSILCQRVGVDWQPPTN